MSTRVTLILGATLILSACSTTGFSGLSGADPDFKCKAPEGVSCTSVSGVFANASQHNLPAQRVTTSASPVVVPAKGAPVESVAHASYSPRDLTAPKSGDPIRVPALVLRVWVAPWEDADGDLHDQNYVYTVLRDGRWKIEANRERIRDEFRPLFPLKSKKSEGADEPGHPSADGDEGGDASATHAQMGGMPK